MRRAGRALVLASVTALGVGGGCRGPEPGPRPRWTAASADAGELADAQRACTAEATRASEAIRGETTATNVAITEFIRCMERRGWRLERPEGGAAASP